MTYVSRKEKVFDLPEQDEASSPSLGPPEPLLRRLPSGGGPWAPEEGPRFQGPGAGESSLSKSSSFKYIPFDVLLAILMAEKDAYIQELLDRQDDNRSGAGEKLYKAEGFEDSDDDREALIRKDAEVVSLKNKIAGLESELEDYRDTLTKAMHKLENMDAVMSENSLLREKMKYSEETIKCLEERKGKLEKELECLKKTSPRLLGSRKHWDGGDCEEVIRLSSERDVLLRQVTDLQMELEMARMAAAEMEVLRKISKTTSVSLEEVSRENECYKKKLENMKYLEKHIDELRRQAHTLTDKYKRESQKASDHLKLVSVSTKELQALREERNKLEDRVNELTTYENQYLSLKKELHQVELIIDENESLNRRLIQLDRLEVENEQLKEKIEHLKAAEIQVADDKERILQLQCAVVDQEEEIRKMLRQIEELSQGYTEKNEICRMRNELEEKNGKLKVYEKQLAEIPVLETEIDELRNKLQKCIDDFKTDKDLLGQVQEELEACRRRCHELEEMAPLFPGLKPTEGRSKGPICDFGQTFRVDTEDKMENTMIMIPKQNAELHSLKLQYKDQKVETLLTHVELSKLDEQNKTLKSEVQALRGKLSLIDFEDLITQTKQLKELLGAKDKRIHELEFQVFQLQNAVRNAQKLKETLGHLEDQVKHLKDMNQLLEKELALRKEVLRQANELEDCLRREKKAREFASDLIRDLEEKLKVEAKRREVQETVTKLQKEEVNVAKQELYQCLFRERGYRSLSLKLIEGLKTENQILREMKEYSHTTEKSAMTDLINQLQAEVKVLKSLSKPELQGECEALQMNVKQLLEETDGLAEEIKELKFALDSEKIAKDHLEKELTNLQAELSACITVGKEVLGKEIAKKESQISSLQQELAAARTELENLTNEAKVLRNENIKLFNNYNNLKSQQKDLESEINLTLSRLDELNNTVKVQEERERQQAAELASYRDAISSCKNDSHKAKELAESQQEKVKSLEDLLRVKEEEIVNVAKASWEVKAELNKVTSEMEVLKCRLSEKESGSVSEINYERDLEEKYALEDALRKIENELDELKVKLEECKMMEEEMVVLRSKKNTLLEKMSEFETEINVLKGKLFDFESIRNELEQLKAEKKLYSEPEATRVSELCRELQQQRSEAERVKIENEGLKEELQKSENLLEMYKKLQQTLPQVNTSTAEFFTPPALPSPHSNEPDPETIPLETHRKELNDLENHYKLTMRKAKDSHADMVKKLTAQHEREAERRSKAFYETVNGIKASYENDIRKLVEKHKSSILRLQSLHEDEVRELNENYETQMEAMQTQNENVVNDLRTESVEKCKRLIEQHNGEIQELEEKYEALLRERESQVLSDTNAIQSTNEIKEVHKQTVDSLTQFYQSSILEMKEEHGKELKKCKKSNFKIIEVMKNKYEALLVEERKRYEEQLEEMLLQIKQGQRGDTREGEKHFFQKKVPSANPCLEFLEVLQKIINEGLESLTFEELVLVHSKTCFVPESVGEEGEGGGCGHRALVGAEKEELLRRIFVLEQEIVIKQLETHEAIVNMETAEQYRIQELKDALSAAQKENAELKKLVSNQSKLQMDMKIEKYMLDKQVSLHETNVMEKVRELEKEKSEKKCLEEELHKERANVKHLTATLEAEMERFRSQRKRDSDYVDSIRLRLEEVLNHEQMMESQLEYEARFRVKLESELQALQRRFNLIVDLPHQQGLESKAVKDLKNFDQCDTSREEFHSRSRSKAKGVHNL